ncbi:MAG TPA: MerR family transcriptional regulator [Paucimonas sp.]|nr:MerR family transcriptional regulator [Paucimonas sp.]
MSNVYSVTQLARYCGISRTTLLYYEGLGLIRCAARSDAGYRRYGPKEVARLTQICAYRDAGLPLKSIAELLDAEGRRKGNILQRRLRELNKEIAGLREQQQLLIRLLASENELAHSRVMNKQRWVALLRGAGMDDASMERWHAVFEAQAPEAHQDFLESLGLAAAETAAIRERARRCRLD